MCFNQLSKCVWERRLLGGISCLHVVLVHTYLLMQHFQHWFSSPYAVIMQYTKMLTQILTKYSNEETLMSPDFHTKHWIKTFIFHRQESWEKMNRIQVATFSTLNTDMITVSVHLSSRPTQCWQTDMWTRTPFPEAWQESWLKAQSGNWMEFVFIEPQIKCKGRFDCFASNKSLSTDLIWSEGNLSCIIRLPKWNPEVPVMLIVRIPVY